jgi:sulfate adenylyltransferase subunit 1
MHIEQITMLGHKDHGKSTLIGALLMATGSATEERVDDAKSTSKHLGRKFEPAYILDAFSEEREGGLTIDTARAQVKYKGRAFEFIDVPGHEELIKNMLSGASYANTAVLVVSAAKGEGIMPQTKRHLFLAKMLGIEHFIIAVNKMDEVDYSQNAYEQIKSEIASYLDSIGVHSQRINFVPISAYNSENLISKSENTPWFRGKPLMDLLLTCHSKNSASDMALRAIVQGTVDTENGIAYTAKMLSGRIEPGSTIRVLPLDKKAVVKSLYVKGKKAKSASAEENIAINISKDMGNIRGSVISNSNQTKAAQAISTMLFFVKPISGKAELRFNGSATKGTIVIDRIIDTSTGMPKNSVRPKQLDAGECIVKLDNKVAVEEFSSFKGLGRFVFYKGNEFAGIGIVEKVLG